MDWGILIPLAGIGVGGLAIWTGHQRKMAQLRFGAGALAGEEQTKDLRALEARIQVLERIVTDKQTDLAREIEALRDAPAIETAVRD